MKNTLSIFAAILVSSLVMQARNPEPVNPILGDEGFVAQHGRTPTMDDSEAERIRTHLQRVIHLLRAAAPAGLGAEKSARRSNLLDALEDYIAAGEFPRNTVFPGRRPVFIDPEGRLCAVGYLVAKSSGREAAEKIAASHRYDYLLEMNEPLVNSWAEENGFTLRELASIQPTYSDFDFIVRANDITSGLIAYYPFNSNSLDESGNSRHLEVFNSEIKSNGPLGGYLDQNQPISISKTPVTGSSAPELRVSTFSISMWIKPRTLDRVSEWLYLIEATGGPTLRIGSTTTSFQDHYKNIDFMARSPLIADFKENEWQHLVVTHDKGKSVFYLNGGEVFNATTSIAYFDINNFIIGNGGGFKYFFDGGLDEIRIYNRALSPEDVAFLCDKESGKSEMVFVKRGTLPQGSELAGQEVASFLVSRFETTWSEWKKVREWAASNGYDIGEVGQGISNSHPVIDVSWYDVVKWLNAKSEMEGLEPVYSYNGNILRTGAWQTLGSDASDNIIFDLQKNGYRLPTISEWEWAARGGAFSQGYTFSGSNDVNDVAWYSSNAEGTTNPVGTKLPNEIGLYDMSGNVMEWCWNRIGIGRYARGGTWNSLESEYLANNQFGNWLPSVWNFFDDKGDFGFRYARNFEQPIFSETAGTYIGNFGAADLEEPAAALLRNGQVLITLQANRQFTGALVFNGQKVGFRGRFDEDGNWSGAVTVARRLVEIELFLEAGELGNRVSCLVVFNGEESTAFVLLPAAHTGAKGDVFGWNGARLNVLLESTGSSGKRFGHGFAGATCAKDGVLRFAGRLADNSAWSGAARVVRDEGGGLRLPLALALNATKGLLHGEGTLDLAADVQAGEAEFFSVGTWTWVRGADARAKAHKEGFVEGLQPFGQRWSYRRGTNPWTGQMGEMSVRLMLGMEAGAPGALGSFTTAWPLNNRPVWSPIPPRGFQFTATTARGEFSGKIPARSGGVVIPATSYRGALLTPGVARGDGILLGGGFLAGSESSEVVELTDPDP